MVWQCWYLVWQNTKKEVNGERRSIKIWGVNAGDIVNSKLIETKNNSKYMIRYLLIL